MLSISAAIASVLHLMRTHHVQVRIPQVGSPSIQHFYINFRSIFFVYDRHDLALAQQLAGTIADVICKDSPTKGSAVPFFATNIDLEVHKNTVLQYEGQFFCVDTQARLRPDPDPQGDMRIQSDNDPFRRLDKGLAKRQKLLRKRMDLEYTFTDAAWKALYAYIEMYYDRYKDYAGLTASTRAIREIATLAAMYRLVTDTATSPKSSMITAREVKQALFLYEAQIAKVRYFFPQYRKSAEEKEKQLEAERRKKAEAEENKKTIEQLWEELGGDEEIPF